MLIKCPSCSTLVQVNEKTLAADGMTRCSHCGTAFSAHLYMSDTPSVETPEVHLGVEITPDLVAESHAIDSTHTLGPEDVPEKRATAAWLFGILLLSATLLTQIAYHNRTELARHMILRPWLELICGYAGCKLPLPQDKAQLRFVARSIHAHPRAADALLVTLTIENEAPFPQAYPSLRLSFFDLAHNVLARRSFTPQEYLPLIVRAEDGLASRQPFQIQLEIVDPGPAAVNFEFEFG